MTLTELRCLVAIVEADLNISAAAQNMHSTQPALSRHLKQLEDELGFQIFSRRGRSLVEVTPAGEEVLKIARRVVADVSSLRSYAANHRGDKSGDLLLATTQTYAKHVLPSVLSRLLRRYPELSVHLSPLGEGESLPPVAHNSTDLALVSTAGTEVPDGVAIPLFRWRRVVIVKPSHPLARGGRMPTLAEMAERMQETAHRARPGAALSMPLAWEELGPDIGPAHFTVANAPGRLAAQKRDPWQDFRSAEMPLRA